MKDKIMNISEVEEAANDFEKSIVNKEVKKNKTYVITSLESIYILESLVFGYRRTDVPVSYIKFDENERMEFIIKEDEAKFRKMDLSNMIKLSSKWGKDITALLMTTRASGGKSVELHLEVENNEVVDFGYKFKRIT